MMPCSSHACFDLSRRARKAEKIDRLLGLCAARANLRLLEVGTGSGAIAHYFARRCAPSLRVSAVDTCDQRRLRDGYEFNVYDGRKLPFPAAAFDVVISNHVIEHVGGRACQAHHIGEICRVLAPGGRFYLATPSRWQPVEPHFSLPFLGWIPRRWRDGYVRAAGKGERYDCDLLGPRELRRLIGATGLASTNLTARAARELSAVEDSRGLVVRLAARLPMPVLNALRAFSPTLVYVLRKPAAP